MDKLENCGLETTVETLNASTTKICLPTLCSKVFNENSTILYFIPGSYFLGLLVYLQNQLGSYFNCDFWGKNCSLFFTGSCHTVQYCDHALYSF